MNGAQIICHPANLVLPFAQQAMLTRSIENRVFTVTANRIGSDVRSQASLEFTGQSQITNPKMERLVYASKDLEEVGTYDIDLSLAENKNLTERNHLFEDRRIDLYSDLVKKDFSQK